MHAYAGIASSPATRRFGLPTRKICSLRSATWTTRCLTPSPLVRTPPLRTHGPHILVLCSCDLVSSSRHTSEAQDFIQKILKVDPDSRPSCSKLAKHPWI